MATYNNPSGSGTSGIGGTSGMGNTGTSGIGSTGTSGVATTGSKAADLGEDLSQKASGVTGSIGERLERAGDFLEEKGKAQFISDRLQNAGRYLQENDVRSMARSVDDAICAHPYRGILIGLGLGWVVGRFLSGRGE